MSVAIVLDSLTCDTVVMFTPLVFITKDGERLCMCRHRFVLGVEACTCRLLGFLTWWTVCTWVTCYKEESGKNMNVFRLTVIDECSYCL